MSTIAPPHRGDPFFRQMFQAVSTTGGQFYVRMEDEICLSVFTTTASLTVTLNGILLDLDGDAKPFNLIVNPTSDGVRTSKRVRIGPGFVLYCQPTLAGGTPAVGNTTVLVEVVQSDNATGPVVKQVLFGSLTAGGFYPYTDVANTVTVSGTVTASQVYVPTLVTQADPAAGADFTITCPASTVWQVQELFFRMTTSATVANRNVRLTVKTGATVLASYWGDDAWAASQVSVFAFGGSVAPLEKGSVAIRNLSLFPMPPFIMTAGMTLNSTIENIAAADQLSGIRLSVLATAV